MSDPYQIVEGIAGVWHYHLAPAGASVARGLCGAQTMATCAPLSTWGFKPGHIRHSYCTECARLAGLGADTVR